MPLQPQAKHRRPASLRRWSRAAAAAGETSSLVLGLYAKNQNRQAVLAHLNQQSTGITSLRHHALSLPVHRDKAMPGVLGLARLVVPRMESRGLGSRRIHKTRSLLLPFGSDNAPSDVQRRGAIVASDEQVRCRCLAPLHRHAREPLLRTDRRADDSVRRRQTTTDRRRLAGSIQKEST